MIAPTSKKNMAALGALIFLAGGSLYKILNASQSFSVVKEQTIPRHPRKHALIFGITGQDGSYLAEFLLAKGYVVHGVVRRSSSPNTSKIDHLKHDASLAETFKLHDGDVCDGGNIQNLLKKIMPDEVYNLAAQSHVGISFQEPEYTAQVDGMGCLRILEAIRTLGLKDKTKFYQASTSELYGKVQEIPQRETTPFYPRSPYGVAKIFGYWTTVNYREAYGIFACNGILFNHESPRRPENFVTRKITRAVAGRACGEKEILRLGNLDSSRDWGYAPDYVEAMWLILQQPHAEDFVIATGKTYSVRDFVEKAFAELGIKVQWQGTGIDEVGIDSKTKEILVKVDPLYFRPSDVDYLVGDSTKARAKLGWKPKTTLDDLTKIMVQADIQQLRKSKGA